MRRPCWLLALSFSQATALAVQQLRTEIYRKTGEISARAFTPIIPLFVTDERPIRQGLPEIPSPFGRGAAEGLLFRELVSDRRGGLFLASDSRGSTSLTPMIEALMSWEVTASGISSRDVTWGLEGLIPHKDSREGSLGSQPDPGIFLAIQRTAHPVDSSIIAKAQTIPPIRDLTLVCLEVRSAEHAAWWTKLQYGELWRVHLR